MRKLSLILATFAFASFANTASAGNLEATFVWNPDSKTVTIKDGTNTKGDKLNDEQKQVLAKILQNSIDSNKDAAATLGLSSIISGLLGAF